MDLLYHDLYILLSFIFFSFVFFIYIYIYVFLSLIINWVSEFSHKYHNLTYRFVTLIISSITWSICLVRIDFPILNYFHLLYVWSSLAHCNIYNLYKLIQTFILISMYSNWGDWTKYHAHGILQFACFLFQINSGTTLFQFLISFSHVWITLLWLMSLLMVVRSTGFLYGCCWLKVLVARLAFLIQVRFFLIDSASATQFVI